MKGDPRTMPIYTHSLVSCLIRTRSNRTPWYVACGFFGQYNIETPPLDWNVCGKLRLFSCCSEIITSKRRDTVACLLWLKLLPQVVKDVKNHNYDAAFGANLLSYHHQWVLMMGPGKYEARQHAILETVKIRREGGHPRVKSGKTSPFRYRYTTV